jgi:ComEC/Rec2-related protein
VGDGLRIRGTFVPIMAPANPGERDDRPWAAQEGRIGRVTVSSAALVEPWKPPGGMLGRVDRAARRGLAGLRSGSGAILDAALDEEGDSDWGTTARDDQAPSEGRALLGALLLGRNDPALRPLSDAMSRLGQVHVLSISGFHLALMSIMAMWVIRFTGDRGRLEPAIVAALVGLYLLIVPAQAPVLRSGLMVLALLAGDAAGRRYDRLNILGYVAIALLVWRPMDLWSPGFQLSFGVTGALVWLGRPFQSRLFPTAVVGTAAEAHLRLDPGERGVRRWAIEQLKSLVSASLLCWAVATPVVMYHVGILSPLAALTSVVLVPVFAVLLWAGFAVLAIGVVSPMVAGWAGTGLLWLSESAARLTHALDGMPWMAINMPQVSALWACGATLVAGWWCARGSIRSGRDWLLACIVLVWLALTLGGAASGRLPAGTLARVDALAVGDGSAVLIRSGRHAVLWGGHARTPETIPMVVPRAARALGAWRVRTVVLATPDPRSAIGLADLATSLGVCDALMPSEWVELARQQRDSHAGRLIARLEAAGVTVRPVEAGAVLVLGEVTLALDRPAGTSPGAWAGVLEAPGGGPAVRAPLGLLLEGLARSALESAMDAGRWASGAGAAALSGPGRAGSWERVEQWTISANPVVVWRSEGPRLGAPERDSAVERARGRYTTSADGAVWVEWARDGRVRHGAWRD